MTDFSAVRKSLPDSKTNKPIQDPSHYYGDEQSISKQLASFLALRHEPDFRYSSKISKWLVWDSVIARWRTAAKEPLEAARQICQEAGHVMGRAWCIATDATARDVVRLAEIEPAMRAEVRPYECEPELGRLLARGGRHG